MEKVIVIFIVVQLISVLIGTTKTIVTVRGSFWAATFVNGLNSAVYTLAIIQTSNADLTDTTKAIITGIVTVVGVAIVKYIQQKLSKDKLWIFIATINEDSETLKAVEKLLKAGNIKLLYNKVTDNLYSLQVFSNNKKESELIRSIFDRYDVKYAATEAKAHA